MKSIGTKEVNFSLHNIENYKKDFDVTIDKITCKYSELLIEYYKFITDNINIKNKSLSIFILIRGIDTITNVFLNILFYTKNIDITYFHCQKSFYFYLEFVSQISEEEKTFLQLTSRDASTYVYKKTIFEINNEIKKKNEDISDTIREKISIINSYVNIYKTYMYKLIQNENYSDNKNIQYFLQISNKLNNLNNKNKIKYIELFVDSIYTNVTDCTRFFEINIQLVKKFFRNQEILDKYEKKYTCDDFLDKLNGPLDKFITWAIC
jgi:hypothetical protein